MDEPQATNTDEELKKLYSLRKEVISTLLPDMENIEGVTAERKVEIYMTAARMTNDSELIRLAYRAAKEIPDTALRAEAMVDIIQETNYAISTLESTKPY